MNQQNRLEDLCFMFQRTFQTGQYEGVETKGDVVVPWRSLLTLILFYSYGGRRVVKLNGQRLEKGIR